MAVSPSSERFCLCDAVASLGRLRAGGIIAIPVMSASTSHASLWMCPETSGDSVYVSTTQAVWWPYG
jgi:hypothetical protein